MTLQRRLLLLLAGVPLIWLAALVYSVFGARQEINELFDTQQIRLAQQVAALLPSANFGPSPLHPADFGSLGAADLDDLSVAVWASDGTPLLFDREGASLPFAANVSGFVETRLNETRWRVFFLRSIDGARLVAVGQSMDERNELLRNLVAGQVLPWLLTLPLLLIVIAGAVRRSLAPVRILAHDLEARGANDLRAVPDQNLPKELQPMLTALNRLFERIGAAIEHERRLTEDAAHELRTPLAALRAQWEAAQLADGDGERRRALARVGISIDRLSHLVAQLLALAGAESSSETLKEVVDWPRVVSNVMSDCLPLINSKGAEVEVHWPEAGQALPLLGDQALLSTMLRNLIDNALRYAAVVPRVHVRFASDAIVVEDNGPGISPGQMTRLGDRFHRPAGQSESGSGLGISIVKRIAALHGLEVQFENRIDPEQRVVGLRVQLRRRASAGARN